MTQTIVTRSLRHLKSVVDIAHAPLIRMTTQSACVKSSGNRRQKVHVTAGFILNIMIRFESPWRDVQQTPPVAFCRRCGGEIYAVESIYIADGEQLCAACYSDCKEGLYERNFICKSQGRGCDPD